MTDLEGIDALAARLRARKVFDAARGQTRAPTEEELEAADALQSAKAALVEKEGELAAMTTEAKIQADACGSFIQEAAYHKARAERAEAELAAVRADAQRWQWWKENCSANPINSGNFRLWIELPTNDEAEFDAAIDAAIADGRGKP